MNAIRNADNKRFHAGAALIIALIVAPIVIVIAGSVLVEAQVPPEILYERDIQQLQRMPEKRPPQPAEVRREAPPTPKPPVPRAKPEVEKFMRPVPLESKSELERVLRLAQEELKGTEADIGVYQAEIEQLRIRQQALREDVQQGRKPAVEAEKDIQQLKREISLREKTIGALEKKKAALIQKIDSLNRKIGLLK
jgi:peptidoglycan hydrolase CwlO-like protein